jgi:tetratricopeptide (TPR) repeat protein
MKYTKFPWLAALAWIVCFGLPASAQAQNPPDATKQFNERLSNATAYIQLKQYSNAAQEFLAAYELDPKPELLYNAGLAYWYGSDRPAALALYARFLERVQEGLLAEKARESFYEVAETEWQGKAFGAALDHYEQYIQYDAAGRNVDHARDRLFEHAERIWQSGQKDASLAHYERFVRLAPDHPKAAMAHERPFELAEELWRAGERERALDYYQRFAQSEPKVAATAIARARIFERGEEFWQRGDKEKAIAYYERYLTIEVNDEIAQRARGRIAEHTAEREKARVARLAAEQAAERARLQRAGAEPSALAEQTPKARDGATPGVRAGAGSEDGRGSRLRVSGLVHAVLDYKARGAAAQAGVDVRLGLGLEARVAGIFGPTIGAYVGGARRFGVLRGLDMTVGVGMPVFFSNGARIGVRGSGALEWDAMRHVAVVLELGVEHVFNAEWDREGTVLIPLLGVRAH